MIDKNDRYQETGESPMVVGHVRVAHCVCCGGYFSEAEIGCECPTCLDLCDDALTAEYIDRNAADELGVL